MSEPVNNSYQLLPPLERAEHFNKLISEDGVTASELARELGKSLSFISNTLRLLKLPPLVQEGLKSSDISEGHARALLSIKDESHVVIIYREILTAGISVRDTEKMVRKMNG